MQTQVVTLDVLKPIGTTVDLSDSFNARVGDKMTPFQLFITEGGVAKDLKGMHPELEAIVGNGALRNGVAVMAAGAKGIHWVGSTNNVTGYNQLTLAFPAEVFPQSGFCYGHLILANDAGVRETSVDIWFQVLDGTPLMGLVADHYDSELQLELAKAKNANDQFSQEMRNTYNQQVTDAQNALTRVTSDLSHLSTSVGEVQAQINAGNVVTLKQHKDDLKKVSDKIDNRLDKMTPDPESFADLDAIKAKYPTGKDGIFVLDNGHRAVYRNGQWIDGGVYQAVGIKDGSVGSKQVSTISASKIIDNQLSPSDAEGQGNISVVGNNEYVMIVSNEVQTADKLVGTFIPLTITNKGTLILTANITSSLDAGYTQALFIADKNKTVLRQLGNVNVPDKNSAINAKESLKITEDPGNYYLLITSKAVGTVTYRKLTVNVSGSPASTVVEEIGNLTAKIDKSPTVTTRAFDTIINNDVQLDKVSATDGIELTRDVNTITAKVNKAHSADETQAIFFPVHVQNRNAAFTGTVKVAPIKFPETYTQQIYLADAERNLGELLGTFPVNSQSSADFKVKLPSSHCTDYFRNWYV